MATEWYYKQSDEERGPYLFREMIDMVREERLLPESMVRPSYMDEWQRADSVPGLFYLSRKAPVTLYPVRSEETCPSNDFADENDLDAFLADSDGSESTDSALPEQPLERPGWLKRLLSLRDSKIPPVPVDPQREINVNLHAPVDNRADSAANLDLPKDSIDDLEDLNDKVEIGAYSEETWSTTVNAAVQRIDARAPRQESQPAPRQIIPFFSFSFLESLFFRKLIFAGAVILCLTAAIYGFVDWMGQGTLLFPFIGACSPLMFLIYSALTLIAVMAVSSLLIFLSSYSLRVGFKFGAVLLTANLTAFSLLNWSHEQANLFPSRRPAEVKSVFPLMGECSYLTYWMCFVDVVIFVGIATYFLASWLESQADDV